MSIREIRGSIQQAAGSSDSRSGRPRLLSLFCRKAGGLPNPKTLQGVKECSRGLSEWAKPPDPTTHGPHILDFKTVRRWNKIIRASSTALHSVPDESGLPVFELLVW